MSWVIKRTDIFGFSLGVLKNRNGGVYTDLKHPCSAFYSLVLQFHSEKKPKRDLDDLETEGMGGKICHQHMHIIEWGSRCEKC